jgi:D-arabinose 1-dehydrogenase-like Zn-dependent alcohol dehydrogenase
VRAAVLDDHGLTVRDWPDPEPAGDEALVALTRVGICGSDVHFVLDGTTRPAYVPIVLGHEPAGRVVALGPDADGPPVGTRVAVVPLVTCGTCPRCAAGRSVTCAQRACLGAERDGCWADLVSVPARNLIALPDGIDDATAAVATDAVANAYHAVVTRGALAPGMRVAVWGAGGLGTAAVAIARRRGAAHVLAVDPRPAARERALRAGADDAVAPSDAREAVLALGGVDLALELVGRAASVDAAVRALDDGGRAVVVGLGDESLSAGSQFAFVLREREVVGSYGAEPGEVRAVIELLAAGELAIPDLVAEEVALDGVLDALRRVRDGDVAGRLVVAL